MRLELLQPLLGSLLPSLLLLRTRLARHFLGLHHCLQGSAPPVAPTVAAAVAPPVAHTVADAAATALSEDETRKKRKNASKK
jgi:hypothetical protein